MMQIPRANMGRAKEAEHSQHCPQWSPSGDGCGLWEICHVVNVYDTSLKVFFFFFTATIFYFLREETKAYS